jgi:uncharacterized paraquat-inducible protein A
MHIITHTCPNCGTIVSANFLEQERITKCPRYDCEEVVSFDDLPESKRTYFFEHAEEYQI